MFFFELWIRKLSSATRIAKNQRNLEENTKGRNKGFSGMSGPRPFFRGFAFWFLGVFFVFGAFCVFCSCWFW